MAGGRPERSDGGTPEAQDAGAVDPGLCGQCAHARIVDTTRSRFFLCERSFSDTRFPKYPVLPVRVCQGFEKAGLAG